MDEFNSEKLIPPSFVSAYATYEGSKMTKNLTASSFSRALGVKLESNQAITRSKASICPENDTHWRLQEDACENQRSTHKQACKNLL